MSETVAIFTEKKELYAIPLIVSKHGYRTHIVNTLKDLKGAAQRGKAQAVILDLDGGLDEHLELLERIVREKDPAISALPREPTDRGSEQPDPCRDGAA